MRVGIPTCLPHWIAEKGFVKGDVLTRSKEFKRLRKEGPTQ